MGIVVATRRKNAVCGLFFARKKHHLLRMVVDMGGNRTRSTVHRMPPHTTMASVEGLASVNVEAAWQERVVPPAAQGSLFAASVDLKDGVHQFLNVHLAFWFVFDFACVTVGDLCVSVVCNEQARGYVKAEPDEIVWPAYGGMAMGWSWTLWICHETLASVMDETAWPGDGHMLDKHPSPSLAGGATAAAPYVDNAN